MNGMDRHTGKPLAGVDHLKQSIEDILSTPVGTRLARRDYGSHVPELIDQPNNELGRTRIFAAAALALLRQEGRARISLVTLSAGANPSSVVIGVEGRRTDVAGMLQPFSFSLPVRARSALAL